MFFSTAAVRSEMPLAQKERSPSCLSCASKSISAFCTFALVSSKLLVTGFAGFLTSSLSFFAAPVLSAMLKVPVCPSQTGESASPVLKPLCHECPGPACCGTSPSGMVTPHRADLLTPPKLCPLSGVTVRDPREPPPLTSAGFHDTCKSTDGVLPTQGCVAPPQRSVDTTAVFSVSSRIGTGTAPTPTKTPRSAPGLPVLSQTSTVAVGVPPSSTHTLPGLRLSSSLTSARSFIISSFSFQTLLNMFPICA
mmetsp:Transcript_87721/g.174096  ORF Transcript_87721/g.174096 Transcript_87721/m.174096 type:complete len:251 (-) Transcript_87721:1179-1931(-)